MAASKDGLHKDSLLTAEAVVQANPVYVYAQFVGRAGKIFREGAAASRTKERVGTLPAELGVEVFRLHAPAVRERKLTAAANSPPGLNAFYRGRANARGGEISE